MYEPQDACKINRQAASGQHGLHETWSQHTHTHTLACMHKQREVIHLKPYS